MFDTSLYYMHNTIVVRQVKLRAEFLWLEVEH